MTSYYAPMSDLDARTALIAALDGDSMLADLTIAIGAEVYPGPRGVEFLVANSLVREQCAAAARRVTRILDADLAR